MSTITLKAPAKINLWLDIKSKRSDGYHNIESVMQTVTLFDEITIERLETVSQSGKNRRHISISCTVNEIACDESNLCYRAAQEFFNVTGKRSYSVAIHIEKNIPIAAGLAGGSTDAATTLIGMNKLYNAGLTSERLCEIGRRIGADVPFCIRRGISITRGIGEIFSHCEHIPHCHILVACEGERVSTPVAYRTLDEMYDFSKRIVDIDGFKRLLDDGKIGEIAAAMNNIFESAILPIREKARNLKKAMLDCGALNALMSGSGPSVFGIFETNEIAENARRKLSEAGIETFLCEPYYES
jgi:4-diphosphocytidyl-2-C-methyl-D-erythritol kinase